MYKTKCKLLTTPHIASSSSEGFWIEELLQSKKYTCTHQTDRQTHTYTHIYMLTVIQIHIIQSTFHMTELKMRCSIRDCITYVKQTETFSTHILGIWRLQTVYKPLTSHKPN